VSLLITDLVQAAGGIMNVKWVIEDHVALGGYCTSQGAIKQVGNLGTALWSLVRNHNTWLVVILGLNDFSGAGDRRSHVQLALPSNPS
jgi:hypothetical protein